VTRRFGHVGPDPGVSPFAYFAFGWRIAFSWRNAVESFDVLSLACAGVANELGLLLSLGV